MQTQMLPFLTELSLQVTSFVEMSRLLLSDRTEDSFFILSEQDPLENFFG